MANYDTVIAWVQTTLDAAFSGENSSAKGAHTTDVLLNTDTGGALFYEEPEDYREVQIRYTGGELVDYFVNVHLVVTGTEATTAATARTFADNMRSSLHIVKDAVGGGLEHNDTEVIWSSQKSGEWDSNKSERRVMHRVRVNITEAYS